MTELVRNILISILLLLNTAYARSSDIQTRERILLDKAWKFAFGHPYDTKLDFGNGTSYFSYLAKAGYGDGAAAAKFDDRAWRKLDLPHDWAVEQGFSPKASYSHGFKAIGANFPEKNIGWYRKTITIPAADLGRRITIDFDGVFRNSIVWVNGHYLGTEPSGYNSFSYDISELINYGGENVISVRVDAGMEEGWFYEGAGIYRHVWLSKSNPLHVEKNGTFVTTDIDFKSRKATVNTKTNVINESGSSSAASLLQTIIDATGKIIANSRKDGIKLHPYKPQEVSVDLHVENINLWDLKSPYLYTLVTTLINDGKETDRYETPFGFRTIRFDAKEGFFLNGKNVKLKGTNNHQDHAGVGAAMPDELQYYRIKALKDMGANAYRCSHNPPTPELLEACDKLGMLVIDETRLMGTTERILGDLKKMIIRDRNHPSIILWSIGNEEWAIENSEVGSRIATTMQAFTKSLDSTRATTAGISGGFRSGISDVLEVMGYNYMGNGDIDAHYKRFPDQPGVGTEEGSTFATRGIYETDTKKHYAAAYDKKPRTSFYSIEEGWKFYAERPHLAGMFIWTGFDYRGEPTPYSWPSITSYFGMMDLCGFPKDNVYYLKSWWSDTPTLHILPHWNWSGKEGKDIDVWVYSNCDEVELFLNKKSLGKQSMKVNSHLEWKVPYSPGTLEAIGYKNGKKILNDIIKTTGEASAVKLSGHKSSLKADAEDIMVVTISAADRNNLGVPTADNEIIFDLKGPARIIGVGNGDPTSLEKDRYIESIRNVKVSDLKERLASDFAEAEKLLGTDDSSWKEAFIGRDYKNLSPVYVHRGTFELPADLDGHKVTWFYKSIGREQSIFINGKALTKNLKENATDNEFALDPSLLKPGKNRIEIIASPIGKKYDWDVVNTDPGTIQIYEPAEQWKRKLFSGLAQVIIQSTGEAGEITLRATSKGLKPGVLTIKSNASTSRLLKENNRKLR